MNSAQLKCLPEAVVAGELSATPGREQGGVSKISGDRVVMDVIVICREFDLTAFKLSFGR